MECISALVGAFASDGQAAPQQVAAADCVHGCAPAIRHEQGAASELRGPSRPPGVAAQHCPARLSLRGLLPSSGVLQVGTTKLISS